MSAKRTRLDALMDNIAAAASPASAQAEEQVEAQPEPVAPRPLAPLERYKQERVWAPGTDGRAMRRTDRDRAFATKIKPDAHEDLKRYAFEHGISIAEALERAIAILVTQETR